MTTARESEWIQIYSIDSAHESAIVCDLISFSILWNFTASMLWKSSNQAHSINFSLCCRIDGFSLFNENYICCSLSLFSTEKSFPCCCLIYRFFFFCLAVLLSCLTPVYVCWMCSGIWTRERERVRRECLNEESIIDTHNVAKCDDLLNCENRNQILGRTSEQSSNRENYA